MKIFILPILAISLLLTSCATYQGYGNFSTNASLSSNNFEIKEVATASAKTTSVLGFGAKHTGLVQEAKANLYKSYNLKKNQTLANPTIDINHTYYLLLVKVTRVILTADIVEFTDGVGSDESIVRELEPENYEVNEQVVFKAMSGETYSGIITSIVPRGAMIEFEDRAGKKLVRRINWQYISKSN